MYGLQNRIYFKFIHKIFTENICINSLVQNVSWMVIKYFCVKLDKFIKHKDY